MMDAIKPPGLARVQAVCSEHGRGGIPGIARLAPRDGFPSLPRFFKMARRRLARHHAAFRATDSTH